MASKRIVRPLDSHHTGGQTHRGLTRVRREQREAVDGHSSNRGNSRRGNRPLERRGRITQTTQPSRTADDSWPGPRAHKCPHIVRRLLHRHCRECPRERKLLRKQGRALLALVQVRFHPPRIRTTHKPPAVVQKNRLHLAALHLQHRPYHVRPEPRRRARRTASSTAAWPGTTSPSDCSAERL